MPAIMHYHGGKVRLAPKIVSLFPSHKCYVEPFGGGAAVLLRKPRAKLEVYNDLNDEVVNLFRVLRERAPDLAHAVALTPFARVELELAYEPTDNEVERARRLLVRSHFGRGGASGLLHRTGFRAAGITSGGLPVHAWSSMPSAVRETAERMRGVVIEHRPATQVISAHDGPSTLHYVDPPYLPETRDPGRDYRHEMTVADHEAMLSLLRECRGAVVLSGYASALYDAALSDWRRVEIKTHADGGSKRTEVIWCNFSDCLPLGLGATEGANIR